MGKKPKHEDASVYTKSKLRDTDQKKRHVGGGKNAGREELHKSRDRPGSGGVPKQIPKQTLPSRKGGRIKGREGNGGGNHNTDLH